MPDLMRSAECPCRRDRHQVHADHIQPGESVWLPNGTWMRFDWTDAPEGASSITLTPDHGPEFTVTPDELLQRK